MRLRVVLLVALWAGLAVTAEERQPGQPLDEIVRQVAQKELEYAQAHARYRYELSIKVQEIGETGRVVGEFEQVGEVGLSPAGRRILRLLRNPRTDLLHFPVQRVELEDLQFIPLFILTPEEIPLYDIIYLARERVDEVDTYLFRLQPNRPARPGERFFEGLVWVDADKLDIVRAHGRALPMSDTDALKGYFRRLEIYRQPVANALFPTYVRAEDVFALHSSGTPLRVRLIVRFSNHQLLEGGPASTPSPPADRE